MNKRLLVPVCVCGVTYSGAGVILKFPKIRILLMKGVLESSRWIKETSGSIACIKFHQENKFLTWCRRQDKGAEVIQVQRSVLTWRYRVCFRFVLKTWWVWSEGWRRESKVSRCGGCWYVWYDACICVRWCIAWHDLFIRLTWLFDLVWLWLVGSIKL